jgi:hypothetical protein
LGQVFSEYFGFALPIFIPPISPQSPSPIIRGWYNRPVSGRSTQSPTAQIKKKKRTLSLQTYTHLHRDSLSTYLSVRKMFRTGVTEKIKGIFN